MKHFFSDSGIWKVMAEFVDPDGTKTHSEGEAVISVGDDGITNDYCVRSNKIKRRNSYRITPVSMDTMEAESTDPDLPRLAGTLNVDGNILHFRYRMDGSEQMGYERIARSKDDVCFAYGTMWDGNRVVRTWTSMMSRKQL